MVYALIYHTSWKSASPPPVCVSCLLAPLVVRRPSCAAQCTHRLGIALGAKLSAQLSGQLCGVGMSCIELVRYRVCRGRPLLAKALIALHRARCLRSILGAVMGDRSAEESLPQRARFSGAPCFLVVQLVRPCSACGAHCFSSGLASRRKLAKTHARARQASACAVGRSWHCRPEWQVVEISHPGRLVGYVYAIRDRGLCRPPVVTPL